MLKGHLIGESRIMGIAFRILIVFIRILLQRSLIYAFLKSVLFFIIDDGILCGYDCPGVYRGGSPIDMLSVILILDRRIYNGLIQPCPVLYRDDPVTAGSDALLGLCCILIEGQCQQILVCPAVIRIRVPELLIVIYFAVIAADAEASLQELIHLVYIIHPFGRKLIRYHAGVQSACGNLYTDRPFIADNAVISYRLTMGLFKPYPVILGYIMIISACVRLIHYINSVCDPALCLVGNKAGKVADLYVIGYVDPVISIVIKGEREALSVLVPDYLIPADDSFLGLLIIGSVIIPDGYGLIRIIISIGHELPAESVPYHDSLAVYDLVAVIFDMEPDPCILVFVIYICIFGQ